MRKIICIISIISILISSLLCIPANAAFDEIMETMELYSDCLLLVNEDNSEVVFAKNEGKQTPPASLTKVITAIVVLENCENMNELVTVDESAIEELAGTGSSLGGIQSGEIITVYDLLCNLLMQSANEAATALANYISNNDRAKFIAMMNEVAERLGCNNSNFVNPHGLDDDNQYTTAEDMAKFLSHALTFPVFEEIFARVTYTLKPTNLQEERTIRNTNKMMSSAYKDYYCRYVKGGKTGSTDEAGSCLVTVASKDGYNYIAVALKSAYGDLDGDGVSENGAFLDCKKMFEWAFENIEYVAISDTNQIVGQVPVKYAKTTDYLTLSPAETVFSLVPIGTDSGSLLVEPVEDTVPEFVKAPVKKGEFVCKGKVLYAGKVIKEIDLVASMDVDIGIFSFLGTIAKSLASSWIVRIIAVVVIIAVIILFFRKRKKDKAKASDRGSYRVLNYNDFMKLK